LIARHYANNCSVSGGLCIDNRIIGETNSLNGCSGLHKGEIDIADIQNGTFLSNGTPPTFAQMRFYRIAHHHGTRGCNDFPQFWGASPQISWNGQIATFDSFWEHFFPTTDAVDNFTSGTHVWTPSAMSGTLNGESWAIVAGSNITFDQSLGAAETVTVTSTTATTFTATTAFTHTGNGGTPITMDVVARSDRYAVSLVVNGGSIFSGFSVLGGFSVFI
jgi:hypothetical protein